MAKGKWKVFSQTIDNKKVYQIGRVKNTNRPLNGGNVEFFSDELHEDREWCEEQVKKLNEMEGL